MNAIQRFKMKPIYCIKCGNEIQSGYVVNFEIFVICNVCYDEEVEKLKEDLWKNLLNVKIENVLKR